MGDNDWILVTDSGTGILVPEGAAVECVSVPFTITVDGQDYVDDGAMDVSKMLEHIDMSEKGGATSCPSPHAWLSAWKDAKNVIAFTLSAALSGSYNSAIAAKHMALEKNPDRNITVVNTCGAGVLPESLMKNIYEAIEDGDSYDEVVKTAEKTVRNVNVVFGLGSLDNLMKAGRLSRLVGYAAHRFSISAIGVATPGGRIELRHKFRGGKKMHDKLIDELARERFCGGELVITHCMNEDGAEKLGHLIKSQWLDAEVSVTPAGGLCSYYMGKGGMIVIYKNNGR